MLSNSRRRKLAEVGVSQPAGVVPGEFERLGDRMTLCRENPLQCNFRTPLPGVPTSTVSQYPKSPENLDMGHQLNLSPSFGVDFLV